MRLPDSLQKKHLSNLPKHWHNYIKKLGNEYLCRNFLWRKAKNSGTYKLLLERQWHKLKAFPAFANQTTTIHQLKNKDLSRCDNVYPGKSSMWQNAKLCRSQHVILTSGQIKQQVSARGKPKLLYFGKHTDPHSFTEELFLCFKFSFPDGLWGNLTEMDMKAGIGTDAFHKLVHSCVSVYLHTALCNVPNYGLKPAYLFRGFLSQFQEKMLGTIERV